MVCMYVQYVYRLGWFPLAWTVKSLRNKYLGSQTACTAVYNLVHNVVSPEKNISAESRAQHKSPSVANQSVDTTPDLHICPLLRISMPDESDYYIQYAALTFCGTALLTCSRIPQVVLVLERQSAKDLSYTSQVCASA